MNNIFLITKREFLTQVKKKSFIILTLLAPVMIIAFGAVIGLMFKANESHSIIEVVDKSGLFKNQLKSNDKLNYVFVSVADEKSKINNLKGNESLDGILILPELSGQNYDDLEKNSRLVINSKIGFDTKQRIISDITNVIKKEKIKQLGIAETQLDNLDKSFTLKTINVSENNKEDSDLSFGVKTGLSMVLMYVTFMFILIYGVRVMRSVLEEKNNRVVEIIISSVKPFELMISKILGVTMVALTQFIIWITMSVIGALVLNTGFNSIQKNIPGGNEEMMSKLDIAQIATQVSHSLLELNFPLIIGVFIIYFLLGYIFYSSIYAAIGSAVDNETETQQFTLFAILPLTLGMYG
ncbi:MAG: ABC transporter permease, partial [Chryseobacterium sp.]